MNRKSAQRNKRRRKSVSSRHRQIGVWVWLMGENVVPDKAVHYVRNLTEQAFTETNESGEPDRLP